MVVVVTIMAMDAEAMADMVMEAMVVMVDIGTVDMDAATHQKKRKRM